MTHHKPTNCLFCSICSSLLHGIEVFLICELHFTLRFLRFSGSQNCHIVPKVSTTYMYRKAKMRAPNLFKMYAFLKFSSYKMGASVNSWFLLRAVFILRKSFFKAFEVQISPFKVKIWAFKVQTLSAIPFRLPS